MPSTAPVSLWLRSDLRLDDHVALQCALRRGESVAPVFCLEPWHRARSTLGHPRLMAHRARFLIEALADLRANCRARGGELLIVRGRAEERIPAAARAIGAEEVIVHAEACPEERTAEARVERALSAHHGRLHRVWGHTLVDPDVMPFSPDALPDVFSSFRKAVEESSEVSEPVGAPDALPVPVQLRQGLDPGELPTLGELHLVEPIADRRAVLEFVGGEAAGARRLHDYVWKGDHLRHYKDTRNGLLGADYSSKLSPWLAQGSLSPRRIWSEVKRYEQERVANESTYWLVFELLWRDFFRFSAAKHGSRSFQVGGLRGVVRTWKRDPSTFETWRLGRTGEAFVDANMREFLHTGFMSNRGRQIVASYLVHELGIDWTWGAAWFESQLLDYDPCSNWGNWAYIAGVGHDPRGGRRFDPVRQAQRHDPHGEYVRLWLGDEAVDRPSP
jgi:deoxyribodipyrimidine photo-lyase